MTGSSIKDYGVLYFGNDWSAENRTSSHHVAERLGEKTRVLYVDSPGLRAPKATRRDFRRLWRKFAEAATRPRPIGAHMWHITVPQIPFRRFALVRGLNLALGRLLVRRAAKFLQFDRTISWFAVPHPGMLARQFGETLVVYYCIDDYAALPDVDSEAVARMDADLLRRADQVFVASSLLLEAKRQLNPSAVHAPHGVDVRLFRAASDTTRPVAEPVRELPHPIIGFYGLIEAWVDLDLIGFLAEQRPTWTFLLIGRLAVDPGPLRRLPNVVFAGAQPYKSLPDWARAFDVAIIPYRLTRQVVNAAPLKLREYLATGKPIVAVSTQEIDRFARYIRIARTREEFLTHVEAALTHDSAADRAQRMEATNDMTWEARVDAVVDVVNQRLQQKERCA